MATSHQLPSFQPVGARAADIAKPALPSLDRFAL